MFPQPPRRQEVQQRELDPAAGDTRQGQQTGQTKLCGLRPKFSQNLISEPMIGPD